MANDGYSIVSVGHVFMDPEEIKLAATSDGVRLCLKLGAPLQSEEGFEDGWFDVELFFKEQAHFLAFAERLQEVAGRGYAEPQKLNVTHDGPTGSCESFSLEDAADESTVYFVHAPFPEDRPTVEYINDDDPSEGLHVFLDIPTEQGALTPDFGVRERRIALAFDSRSRLQWLINELQEALDALPKKVTTPKRRGKKAVPPVTETEQEAPQGA